MKKILFLSILFSGWLLFNSSSKKNNMEEWIAPAWADTLKNPFADNVKAIAEGKKIYENACWSCHGMSGKGDGPASKAINPKPADHTSEKVQKQTDGALFWKITKGRGLMSPYEKIYSKQQRWKIVSFLRKLK